MYLRPEICESAALYARDDGVLRRLVTDGEVSVRAAVARNKYCSCDTRELLSQDPDEIVRGWANWYVIPPPSEQEETTSTKGHKNDSKRC